MPKSRTHKSDGGEMIVIMDEACGRLYHCLQCDAIKTDRELDAEEGTEK